MKTDDPIDKQRAIVSALTRGAVVWTVEHRAALRAVMDKNTEHAAAAQIWKDIYLVLELWLPLIPDRER